MGRAGFVLGESLGVFPMGRAGFVLGEGKGFSLG